MYTTLMHQYFGTLEYLLVRKTISIGTLGPEGTSSHNTLLYLNEKFKTFKEDLKCENALYPTFDDLLSSLLDGAVNYALVPSAYSDITRYFWNPNLKSILTFVYPTPVYGIVGKLGCNTTTLSSVRISTCAPVEGLISLLYNQGYNPSRVETIITPSTTKALEALIEGRVDLAVTNQTSFDKYKPTSEIEFISNRFNVDMVWCLFQLKSASCRSKHGFRFVV